MWIAMWVIPRVAGMPVTAGHWVPLGWLYLAQSQLMLFTQLLSCCAHAYDQFALVDEAGNLVWSDDCRPKGPGPLETI